MGVALCKCHCQAENGCAGCEEKLLDEKAAQTAEGLSVIDSGKLQFLSQVKLFKQLSKEDLPVLASCAEQCEFEVGQVIIRQGDEGHDFFILKTGEASVIVDGIEIVTLSSGDYFGESSLLYSEPRTATVQAFTKISALKVSRAKFDEQKLRDKLEFGKRQAVVGGEVREDDNTVRPPSPKTDEERQLMKEALLRNTNLQTMVKLDDAKLTQLIDKAWKESVLAGKELITEGDLSADFFYIVHSGCFDVVRQDAGAHSIYERINNDSEAAEIGEARAGDTFGELALLYFAPRAATVTARVDSVVWVIHRANFKAVLERTQQEIVSDYKKYLGQVEELSSLLPDEQEQVARSLEEMSFLKDQDIFTQGEPGKDFYILVDGVVGVIKDGIQAAVLTASKERSHCFGEKALIHDMPRTATIKVMSDKAKVLTLDKATFEKLLGPLAEIQKRGKRGRSMIRSDNLGDVATDRTFGNILLADLTKLGILGCGGFGCVELVEHTKTKDTYALKELSKGYITKCRLQKSVMMEKTVQLMCNSDFIVKLFETYNKPQTLHLLLELALGGELFATYNKKGFHGKEAHGQYYVGGTVIAFEHLHSKKIIFRDLKPENLLLTEKGKVKLTDMGLAKVVIGKTFTTCGTPDYFAPELVTSAGHTHAVDWWTLGVLIYELMVGHTPFESPTAMLTYQKVIRGIGKAHFPSKTRGAVEDLVKALCTADPSERLPMLKGGTANIRKHKWYKGFAWGALEKGTMTPPYVPKVKSKKDLGNFSDHPNRPPTVPYQDDRSGWDTDFATST